MPTSDPGSIATMEAGVEAGPSASCRVESAGSHERVELVVAVGGLSDNDCPTAWKEAACEFGDHPAGAWRVVEAERGDRYVDARVIEG
jgi:hypothetical protein